MDAAAAAAEIRSVLIPNFVVPRIRIVFGLLFIARAFELVFANGSLRSLVSMVCVCNSVSKI